MSTETDQRPTNLADALDDLAFILDGFDSLVKLLHKSGVTGFEIDGKFLDLPIDLVGDELQRDLREAARRCRYLMKAGRLGEIELEYVWPKVQQ